MSRVRTHGAAWRWPAVGVRSRYLGRRRVELKVWRRTERGLQVVEEESVVFSNVEVRAIRAWGYGGDGIYRTHAQRVVRDRGRRICPPGNDRSKIHA